MCFRQTSIERNGGQLLKVSFHPEFGRGPSFPGPSCEDICAIQAVQYATGFGVSGSAAGMAWLALVRVWHLGGTYVY